MTDDEKASALAAAQAQHKIDAAAAKARRVVFERARAEQRAGLENK